MLIIHSQINIFAASSAICYLRTKVQAPKPEEQKLEGNLKCLKFALKEGRWGQMLGKWEMTFKENTWWGRTGVGLAQTVGAQLKKYLFTIVQTWKYNASVIKDSNFYGITGMSSVSGKLSKFENHLNETARLV